MLSASELAAQLGVSKGRVSQYVAAGTLNGCFTGEGRARRFDLARSAEALGKRLDKGQLMGNGSSTRAVLKELRDQVDAETESPLPAADATGRSKWDGELAPKDADRYEMARTQKAEEEVRRLRRDNELAAGTLVKASEVEASVSRILAQEIAEFETVLREGARKIADKLGVDNRLARQLLIETWRAHRSSRSTILDSTAEAAAMTEAEIAADI